MTKHYNGIVTLYDLDWRYSITTDAFLKHVSIPSIGLEIDVDMGSMEWLEYKTAREYVVKRIEEYHAREVEKLWKWNEAARGALL